MSTSSMTMTLKSASMPELTIEATASRSWGQWPWGRGRIQNVYHRDQYRPEALKPYISGYFAISMTLDDYWLKILQLYNACEMCFNVHGTFVDWSHIVLCKTAALLRVYRGSLICHSCTVDGVFLHAFIDGLPKTTARTGHAIYTQSLSDHNLWRPIYDVTFPCDYRNEENDD